MPLPKRLQRIDGTLGDIELHQSPFSAGRHQKWRRSNCFCQESDKAIHEGQNISLAPTCPFLPEFASGVRRRVEVRWPCALVGNQFQETDALSWVNCHGSTSRALTLDFYASESQNFGSGGFCVSTVGLDEDMVRK
jgi:hypothetical protein